MVLGETLKEIYPIIFGIFFCSIFVWFFLSHRLFTILKLRHPEKYELMGRPILFKKKGFSIMKFLFGKEWKKLKDDKLSTLSISMMGFSVIYLLVFLFLAMGVIFGYAP